MMYLLNDKFAPITSEIGFLEADCTVAVDAFVQWRRKIGGAQGVSSTVGVVSVANLEEALRRLLPLTSVQSRRYLFVPTRSIWTAFFDNKVTGTDAMPIMSFLAKEVGCRGLRVVAVPNTIGKGSAARGRFGATILEVYGPQNREFLNYVRSISVANDGGKWRFDAAGEPFEFEDLSLYKVRSLRERFTPETLVRYLGALGVRAFDEDFYLTDRAVVVEMHGPVPANLREYTLEEAQARF